MVFNATFNNISVILWRSALLVEEPEKTTDHNNQVIVSLVLFPILRAIVAMIVW
jgi:hypothetical protein